MSYKRKMTLPTDSARRKEFPILSGFIKYFPAAIAGVANVSKLGNDKHNPGQALHHARGKSMDHGDCIVRHLMDVEDLIAGRANLDKGASVDAILLEVNQMVWRALAYSQELHEQFGAPLAPSAKVEEDKAQAAPPIFQELGSFPADDTACINPAQPFICEIGKCASCDQNYKGVRRA